MEGLVERAIRGVHAEASVENQERLAHRVDHVLRVRLDLMEQTLRGENPHVVKVKTADIVDHLIKLATVKNPQW